MKVVVTGGAGFIGSNLTGKLLELGYDVTVLDNLSTGNLENIKEFKEKKEFNFIEGSVTDLETCKRTFKKAKCVFHQAAIPSVQRSIDDPIATNNANINGTLNVLLAAKDCGVEKVVYAASSSVYGDTPTLPKIENMKPDPLSPYAISKLVGEYYGKVFSKIWGIKFTGLRYFNVYGPKQDPNSQYSAVIPIFIKKALQNKPFTIYGDGEQTRDFTFVADAVNANICAMNSSAEGIFNVACHKRISLNELAKKIIKLTGSSSKPIYAEPRAGDVKHSLADISDAKEKLGYRPQYTIEEGLREVVAWLKN